MPENITITNIIYNNNNIYNNVQSCNIKLNVNKIKVRWMCS